MTRGMMQLVRKMVETWKAMGNLWARGLREMRAMGCFWGGSTVLVEPSLATFGSDIVGRGRRSVRWLQVDDAGESLLKEEGWC